jgi:hypothetical protein
LTKSRGGGIFSRLFDRPPFADFQPDETKIFGARIAEDSRIHFDDDVTLRVLWLVENKLTKIATTGGGWETLFQAPGDGRYWERTYPYGEMHGGGPPSLQCLSPEAAKAKYDLP